MYIFAVEETPLTIDAHENEIVHLYDVGVVGLYWLIAYLGKIMSESVVLL